MAESAGQTARIRISLTAGELEIEGPESFVSQYEESIAAVLEKLREEGVVVTKHQHAPVTTVFDGVGENAITGPATVADEPFGEVLHSLTTKSGTDQILLAGYYVGKNAADGTFSTTEAHKLLIEQGVKLSNASQSLKNNLTAKRAFKVGSRFKISKAGIDYLNTLGATVA
ncbi:MULTISPECIES: hypothetical protein [unclassified Aeromicrobium]|uniref:hypothetical protein n=1 Tax=unclassified Aeromicrobium TaxID=2633570 RepID=UPI00396B47BD